MESHLMELKSVILCSCLLVFTFTGCVSHQNNASQQTPPHARFQGYAVCYLKPLFIVPPHGRLRTNLNGANKIESELEKRLRSVFPGLTIIKDEAAIAASPSPALLIEPIIEKMKYVDQRITIRNAFRGSSFVQTRVNFRDLGSGLTIASPVFYRKALGATAVFSIGAADRMLLSRVAEDVFDYVTNGSMPTDSLPPGMDARTVDPSKEELAKTIPIVPKAVISDTILDLGTASAHSSSGERESDAELTETALNKSALPQVRKDAVAQIADQRLIGKIACEARDSSIRLVAVQKLDDQSLLANIAVADRNWHVRLVAVDRLNDREMLNKVVAKDRIEVVREAARRRLAGKSDVAKDLIDLSLGSESGAQLSQMELTEKALCRGELLQVRKDAVARITDQKLIGKVASEARDSGIRLVAVKKLDDQSLLANIAVAEPHWKVRLAAVNRLTAPEVLDTIAAKDPVEAVREAARKRATP